jgi:hypothetical protein
MLIILRYSSVLKGYVKNIFDNRFFETNHYGISYIPVVIKLKTDFEETKTDNVLSKLSAI